MPETNNDECSKNISDDIAELVEKLGNHKVLRHTETCVKWLLEHSDCKGCPSSLACCKVAAISLLSLTPMVYTPRSFQDFTDMCESISDKIYTILKSTDEEEIKKLV